MIDTPTNSFCTWNPLWGRTGKMPVLSEGNLQCTSPDAAQAPVTTTFAGIESGKWYSEILIKTASGNLNVGILNTSGEMQDISTSNNHAYRWYNSNGDKQTSTASTSSYGNSYTTGDIIGIALDMTNGAIYFSKNNTWQDSGDPTSGASKTGAAFTDVLSAVPDTGWVLNVLANDTSVRYILNAGSDSSFAGNETAQGNQDGNEVGDFYYEPPTDYLALCTSNLSAPEIALPGDNFNTKLYTGDGNTTLAVTGVGFEPDFTWIKNRDQTDDHTLVDSVRGATNYLVSNDTDIEVDDSTFVASLDSDGFTVGDDVVVNTSTENYVSWNWKAGGTAVSNTDGTITSSVSANPTAGFSIAAYTGSGANATVGHGLGQVPDLIIQKNRDNADNGWWVYSSIIGAGGELRLDSNDSEMSDGSALWNSTPPTSSVFSVGTNTGVNGSDDNCIAYCFHSVEGYSKVGSYTGNSSSDGTFVYTGFKPAWIMIKNTTTGGTSRNWAFVDSTRSWANVANHTLAANLNDAESSFGGGESVGGAYNKLDLLSNGFKQRESSVWGNTTGKTYLYIAFAESPLKYSNAR